MEHHGTKNWRNMLSHIIMKSRVNVVHKTFALFVNYTVHNYSRVHYEMSSHDPSILFRLNHLRSKGLPQPTMLETDWLTERERERETVSFYELISALNHLLSTSINLQQPFSIFFNFYQPLSTFFNLCQHLPTSVNLS